MIKNIRTFVFTFIITACIMSCAVGIVLADYFSAKNSLNEQHILPPSYDLITGQFEGRIMGADYQLNLPNKQEIDFALEGAYKLLPPQIRIITDIII